VGETVEEWDARSGIHIQKTRVPLGVIAIIYEARPNVTADAAGLCVKTGNAVVLRGSRDAIHSNIEIVRVFKAALAANGFNGGFMQLIEDTTREGARELMRCRDYVDVLIPRGSAALIKTTVEESSVPVIETGAGNCHAYVDRAADFDTAEKIILNGKLSRPSVCNALESLLVDRPVAAAFLPCILKALQENGVEVVGCSETVAICPDIPLATEEDYYTEFLSLKISVKVVGGVDEAIRHINRYSTSHSEVIITSDPSAAERFLNEVDSAAVYVNASTRFTDGFEFGFGAEMGISTQKLHARGPLGLRELTGQKYKITGSGQVR
jgi:glutamate-5-semialdehyde dehydrogenase